MAETPNFGFYRKPRFSANDLADYMFAVTAPQRNAAIREAKFPKKSQVVAYSGSRRFIGSFLAGGAGDIVSLDRQIDRLKTRHKTEPDGWRKSEIKRDINALESVKAALTMIRRKRFTFGPGPADLSLLIEGVRVNTRINPTVAALDEDGARRSGGCVTFIAATQQSRKRIEDRCKLVAALVHWSLQDAGGNIAPLERLCISYDVFGRTIISAPTAIDRLRGNIRGACREAARLWDGVEPPNDYDGPAWR